MPLNQQLFRQIAGAIRTQPQTFDMNHYVQPSLALQEANLIDWDEVTIEELPIMEPCNSALCIGGWAWFLSGLDLRQCFVHDDHEAMGELLGLSEHGADQLFISSSRFWMDQYEVFGFYKRLRYSGDMWTVMTKDPEAVAFVLDGIADGTILLPAGSVL